MAEAGQRPIANEARVLAPRPVMAGSRSNVSITPKEALMIPRRHWLMIVLLTIFGFCCGVGSWYVLKKYYPRYTAQTFIRVLPPVEKDPTMIQTPVVSKDIQYGYRLSMATLLTSQGMLQNLIDRDKIQQTQWFRDFGEIRDIRIRKAVKDLKNRLGAYA
jgi:hypothetical protein